VDSVDMRGRKWILDRTDDGAKAPSARPIRVIEKQNDLLFAKEAVRKGSRWSDSRCYSKTKRNTKHRMASS
jgi:hypothetical protein